MKKIIFLMFLSVYVNAQTNYEKFSKEELKKVVLAKDVKIIELEKNLKTKNKVDDSKVELEKLKKENTELLEIISKNNQSFLYDAFKGKYKDNPNYFNNTSLENNEQKIQNSIILLKSIIKDNNTSPEDKQLAEKALNFNYSYLKLFAFKPKFDEAIATKFDEVKINNLIKELDSIFFDLGSNLEKKKSDFSGVLKNYSKFTCELKQELSKELFKKGRSENPLVKNEFEKLKKANSYSKYPYLVKIIEKAKSNYISYVAEEDLPCILAKKVETPKQTEEEIKEIPKQ